MQQPSLIEELETAVKAGSAESRVNTLRRVTDLFLHDADRLNDEQIKVFDDVLCHMAARIEKTALAELGKRLAPVDTAPIRIIKQLARDEEITVAAPVLTGSARLTTSDLMEVAVTNSQAHLLAISQRASLEPTLTDVLLDRGNRKVVSSLAANNGARFSDAGFTRLVEKAEGDDSLQEIVGLRNDLPGSLLQQLLRHATEVVRSKILALVPPERRKEIEDVITRITKGISKTTEHDYSRAERHVDALISSGQLNEETLLTFVDDKHQDDVVVALARLSSTSVKIISELFQGHRNDALLVPCRAAGLGWPVVRSILRGRLVGQAAADKTIEIAQADYARLSPATAQRTLRFMSVHKTAK